jgi:hypothetical protein
MANLILAGQAAVPAPSTPAGAQRTTYLLSQGGESLQLNGASGIWVMDGQEGLDGGPTEALSVDAAGVDGAFHAGMRVSSLEVWLPLFLDGGDAPGLFSLRQQLDAITNPRRGPVRLTVTRPAGESRWIEGYRERRPQPRGRSTFGPQAGWAVTGLLLRCPDPYWRSDAQPITWGVASDKRLYPYYPYRVNSALNLDQDTVVVVPAEGGSYPLWTATGPATGVLVQHVDTGRSWHVIQGLGAGETLIVDTDPRNARSLPAVRSADGTSQYAKLQAPRDLWPLLPGEQMVRVTISGMGTGSQVSMLPVPLWETA